MTAQVLAVEMISSPKQTAELLLQSLWEQQEVKFWVSACEIISWTIMKVKELNQIFNKWTDV